jgi:phosphohistidine phosphatase
MRLYLVQHGHCLDEAQDPARPLSEVGRREVESVAAIARHFDLAVTRIEHSGKLRAQQTADLFAAALAPAQGVHARPGLAPRDDVAALVHDGLAPDGLMLVGHLPLLERLAGLLLVGDPERRIYRMQNAGILALESASDGRWTIRWAVTPRLD